MLPRRTRARCPVPHELRGSEPPCDIVSAPPREAARREQADADGEHRRRQRDEPPEAPPIPSRPDLGREGADRRDRGSRPRGRGERCAAERLRRVRSHQERQRERQASRERGRREPRERSRLTLRFLGRVLHGAPPYRPGAPPRHGRPSVPATSDSMPSSHARRGSTSPSRKQWPPPRHPTFSPGLANVPGSPRTISP